MDIGELLAQASQHFNAARPMIPMYIHLIISALFPIYAGAHASLSRPSSAAKPSKKDKKETADSDDEEDEEEDNVQKMEGLSPKDAIIFPITAGIVLAGLYWLIKRYGADLINLIMGWYFSGVGVYSVGKLLNDSFNMLISFVMPDFVVSKGKLWKADNHRKRYIAAEDTGKSIAEQREMHQPSPFTPIDFYDGFFDTAWTLRQTIKQKYATKAFIKDGIDFKANLTLVNALSALLGIGSVLYANFGSKPWYLTNLQGFAVCYSALQFMSPTTFATGSLILSGLFFYDIWAVFFTPLMVTVAKNLDQPIKLMFPRPEEPSETPGEPPVRSYSMLGLGDIVLPGLMIGLALRFDLYMFYLRKQQTRKSTKKNDEGQEKEVEEVDKASYVSPAGTWGERFWTGSLESSVKPDRLTVSFPKPYFTASMVGYVAGMLATLGVMSVFQHAQPALLYLVPGVLISLWSTGLVRGEIKQMWEFSEAITGEQLDEEEQKKMNEEDEREQKRKAEMSLWDRIWYEVFGGADEEEKEEGKKEGANDGEGGVGQGMQDDDGTVVAFSITRKTRASMAKGKTSTQDVSSDTNGEEDAVIVNSEG